MAQEIEILSWRPAWAAEFSRLAERLRAAAPPGSTLHHVGSTAVPGLAAKDVIDIQLSVARLGEVDVSALEASGFDHVPGLFDHAPPGAVLAREELAKLYFRGRGRRVHLHVRERGRFNHRYALLCRDYLRASPAAARAYEAVKIALAARFAADADAYCAVKDPVFDLIMAGAESWAQTTAWREPAGA